MSRSTSKQTSRAMFDLHRAKHIRSVLDKRPYMMDVLPDAEIGTYEAGDVICLWRYAHKLEKALSEAWDKGREQGRKMERKGL